MYYNTACQQRKNSDDCITDIEKEQIWQDLSLFIIKTLNKMGIGGIYLNIIKAIFHKSTANITFKGEKLKIFILRSDISI